MTRSTDAALEAAAVAASLDAYAARIVGGELVGTYHRLACARHLRDRARERTADFPYYFDGGRAARFFRFASRLRHYKGEWAGRLITLEPHQEFRLGSVFGWRHVDTGLRRFRTAFNELPRKNGKSLEAAVVALYVTFFDQEPGAEGYVIATKRDQAKIVWNDSKRLVLSSDLHAKIRVLAANLHREEFAQKLEPLGADKDSTDGLNPHLIVVDEFHAQKTRGLIDVMETATGARRQPFNFQITTAGTNPVSPCGDQHDYACKVLNQVLVDETFFAFIAHAEPDDNPFLEATWRKANPNFGVSVKPDDLRALATKAAHMPAAEAAFKQKRLNIWVHATTPWLSLAGWRRGQSAWSVAELAGAPCTIGIDLSSKIDLTAVVALFPPLADKWTRWRVLVWCLTPVETLLERERRDRAPYSVWRDRGFLHTNPGNRIDQDVVLGYVRQLAGTYEIRQVGIDPWNAGNLVKDLTSGEDDEVVLPTVVEVPQNFHQLSAPSKEIEADVLDGLVDAGGHPLMEWCVSNAVVQTDNKENIYPAKKQSRGRIDPVVALVIARRVADLDPLLPAEDPDLLVA